MNDFTAPLAPHHKLHFTLGYSTHDKLHMTSFTVPQVSVLEKAGSYVMKALSSLRDLSCQSSGEI